MKAIETTGKINHEGSLVLDQPLGMKEKNVRVIILVADENEEEEKAWLSAMRANPAFDFLNDEKEDIYSLTNGKPLDDET